MRTVPCAKFPTSKFLRGTRHAVRPLLRGLAGWEILGVERQDMRERGIPRTLLLLSGLASQEIAGALQGVAGIEDSREGGHAGIFQLDFPQRCRQNKRPIGLKI